MSKPMSASVARADLATAIARQRDELRDRAVRLVGEDAADDLVQSTIERALRHLGAFVPGTNLRAWLRRILGNLAVDAWRAERRHALLMQRFETEFVVLCDDDGPPPWDNLTAADVEDAVATLPADFRQTFELYEREAQTYDDISRTLGVRPATVGTRLLRARAVLRQRLGVVLEQAEECGGRHPCARAAAPALAA